MYILIHFPLYPRLPAVNYAISLSWASSVRNYEQQIYLLWFSELAALDKKIDKVQRLLLLHAWMESERETPRRSKRQAKSRRRIPKFRLPHFPLYPIDMPGRCITNALDKTKKNSCQVQKIHLVADKLKLIQVRYRYHDEHLERFPGHDRRVIYSWNDTLLKQNNPHLTFRTIISFLKVI